MTIPAFMIYPSIWMQKTFFQTAEGDRGAKIGIEPARDGLGARLAIRVMAVAHAALQLLYAAVAVLPVCIATVGTIIFTPSPTGLFDRHGSVFERIRWAVAIAFSSLCVPVLASTSILFDLHQLSDIRSFAVSGPITFHGFLLSATLPALANLPHYYAFLNGLRNSFGDDATWCERCVKEALLYIANTAPMHTLLKEADQIAFRWRLAFPSALLGRVAHDISIYDQALDMSSERFAEALGISVARACVSDQTSAFDLLRNVSVEWKETKDASCHPENPFLRPTSVGSQKTIVE